MATTIATFRLKIESMVKETPTKFANADRDLYVQEAVREYSRDKPRKVVAELTGDGSKRTFDPPTGWASGVSIVLSMEYPIDEVPRVMVESVKDDVEVWHKPDGTPQINLKRITLPNGEKTRLEFTGLHVVDDSSSTIPANDFDAVANKAAAVYCRAIAAYYAHSVDQSIAADVVDHDAKAAIFSDLADRFDARYRDYMEAGDTTTPALRMGSHDVRTSYRGRTMWHPRERR